MISRANLAFIHDLLWAAASVSIALWLREGDLSGYNDFIRVGTPVYAFTAGLVFRATGMYRGIWRYASITDLMAIARGVVTTTLVGLFILFIMTRLENMPRSLPIIQVLVLLVGLGGSRFIYRLFKEDWSRRRQAHKDTVTPILLIGADDQAEMFIRHCVRHPEAGYLVVGIVGKDGGRVGRRIHGVEVMGVIQDLPGILERFSTKNKPQKIVLSHDVSNSETLKWLLEEATGKGISLARLPRLTDFQDPNTRISMRPIAVEDLLGRVPVRLDRAEISTLVKGRRVLVTGAGGSIGSELVRQIAGYRPSRLVLLDASEFALYTIDMEVSERFPNLDRRTVLANVRDREVIDTLFAKERPDLVFHAAALKHVPMVEANPIEGVLTNVFGSRHVADACIAAGVKTMVMISTDKAVNPTNVMGASKRIAESYCQALDLTQSYTRFITVRFGNVLGSTGSVVPRFQAQLAAGGPITVTHPEMERFFMTIGEAVELVLQASALGVDIQQQGKIYVLDMGSPVKIVDLARQMISLAGLRPNQDIKIVFTGLRPGEKLYEEIFHDGEAPIPTEREAILLASPRLVQLEKLVSLLSALEAACRHHDQVMALTLVGELVPEFDRMVPQTI